MTVLQTQPGHVRWLVDDFVNRVSGVAHALVVSAEGMPLVASASLPRDRAVLVDRFSQQLTPHKRTELHGALGR